MTPIDQAEALLKAAELIVSNQKLTDLRIAGDYEPDEFDAQELDEANAHLFVWAVPIARALIEKQAALTTAEAVIHELVELKDIKDQAAPEDMAVYAERKPLAWAAARAFLRQETGK